MNYWTVHLRETAQHLLEMVNRPGWEQHARHRMDQLLADPQYSGLREVLSDLQKAKGAARE